MSKAMIADPIERVAEIDRLEARVKVLFELLRESADLARELEMEHFGTYARALVDAYNNRPRPWSSADLATLAAVRCPFAEAHQQSWCDGFAAGMREAMAPTMVRLPD
jgi:hypothetical protein